MTEKQPGSRNCFICGRENPVGLKLDFYSDSPGTVYSNFVIPAKYEGYPDTIHGGIIAAILDECGGRAQMLEPDRFTVTAQLNVRYRLPVPPETRLVVRAKAGHRRGRVSHAHSEIRNIDGQLLAEAELVLVDIPEERFRDVDPEDLGWRVYPDEEEE